MSTSKKKGEEWMQQTKIMRTIMQKLREGGTLTVREYEGYTEPVPGLICNKVQAYYLIDRYRMVELPINPSEKGSIRRFKLPQFVTSQEENTPIAQLKKWAIDSIVHERLHGSYSDVEAGYQVAYETTLAKINELLGLPEMDGLAEPLEAERQRLNNLYNDMEMEDHQPEDTEDTP